MFNDNLKYDLKAGFSVFLLALPLCLGIAMASNFPPVAGILTAIVGGLISTYIGSSRLTIKGPAAGLIVIALGAVTELGGGDAVLGYKRALAVGVVAAIIQILFALFKWAKVAEIMPPSVIHGMLAAIGIIIIAKQSTVFLGVKPHATSPIGLILELPSNIIHLNPEITLIGILSFLIVIFWPKFKKLNFIPASIIVLIVAIPFSYIFDMSHEHMYHALGHDFKIGPDYLINLPGQLLSAVTFPDFSVISSVTSIKYIIMFALVGSIESLLTVCAVDNLDPEKQRSDLNKDLLATGVGNLLSAFIGGLPMISEIVRSKANIDYEAKSKNSNFFHGVFLLVSIILIPSLIRHIPLTALAALLVYTGIRLAAPSEFKKTYNLGIDQFILFVITLVMTLVTDLLVGVGVGILLKIIFHMIRGAKLSDFIGLNYKREEEGHKVVYKLKGAIVFTNFLTLKNLILNDLVDNKTLTLDVSETRLIDHTIQEKLESYRESNGIKIIGLEKMHSNSKHNLSFKKAH